MKIGELAKETGVSIRTLHYYDETSLLSPSSRGDSGHRIYDKSDVVRLHRILCLKKLDLSLEEIRDVIGKSNAQIETLLDRNIESIEAEISEKKETLRTLRGTQQLLDLKDEVDLAELIDFIKDISLSQEYFTEDQLNYMEEREEQVGAEAMRQIYKDIPRLTAEIREAFAANLSPTSPKVLAVVKRWSEIADTPVGSEDEDVSAVARKIVEENPEILSRHKLSQEMVDYMRKAKDHL